MPTEKTQNQFVVAFGGEGVEAILDVTGQKEAVVIEKLSGRDPKNSTEKRIAPQVSAIIMSARINGQRNVEVWAITTRDIGYNEMWRLFDEDPQMIADLIRSHGVNLFGSGGNKDRKIII